MSRAATATTKQFACVPVYLEPHQRLGLTRCEVIPGVTLSKMPDNLRSVLDDALSRTVPRLFRANYVILADVDKYAGALRRRIRASGDEVPAPPTTDLSLSPNQWLVSADDLTRQILVSLILLQRFRFIVGGLYDVELGRTGFRVQSYVNRPIQEVSYVAARAIPLSLRETVDLRKLRRIALLLDPYYRGGLWQTDRMGVALSSLWTGICTPFPHHTFLSLTIVLEALLSDGGTEITHKLAERAAALVSRTRTQRPVVYGAVKALYNIRSKVVHGSAHFKKGVMNWDSFVVTAKMANVPVTKLGELGDLVSRLINAVLARPDLLAIIQKRRPEAKTTEALDEFFLHLTLT